ncbi:hypothetical protein KUTeg_016016 [Tegillarca granosa]|uniref:Glutathione peroxidase n=1 Tax=Tegillarca granosa TaxID=220873 RepID=A0ABQ9ENJ1_TEGGR|nr:hypothetical protein KUTeg_016016 [Tegillarca granosa]
MKGKITPLNKYRGQVTLVVNVASECGYTDGHYKALVQLQNELGGQGKFNVLAFPCNQFGGQEPQDNAAILRFAQTNYKVKFPIFAKINVINTNVPPVWKFLIEKSGHAPTWNFWKYLIDGNGQVINAWGPWVSVEQIKADVVKTYQENIEQEMFTWRRTLISCVYTYKTV